jgi:hypothetical protein
MIKTGFKIVAAVFGTGFLSGLVVGVVGFTMAVNIMASAGAK